MTEEGGEDLIIAEIIAVRAVPRRKYRMCRGRCVIRAAGDDDNSNI